MTTMRRHLGLTLVIFAIAISFFAGYAVARQPHMFAARDALNRAAGQLQVAERDKDGHRQRALDLTNQAISEVNMGIQAGR